MFDTDNIVPVEIKLIDGQIDILLRALELYSFNVNHTWGIGVDDDLNDLRKSLIFHTYESLLAQKKRDYNIAYDVIDEYKTEMINKKKKEYYIKKRNIA